MRRGRLEDAVEDRLVEVGPVGAVAAGQEQGELAERRVLDVVDRRQVGELAARAEDEREAVGLARLLVRERAAARARRAVAHLVEHHLKAALARADAERAADVGLEGLAPEEEERVALRLVGNLEVARGVVLRADLREGKGDCVEGGGRRQDSRSPRPQKTAPGDGHFFLCSCCRGGRRGNPYLPASVAQVYVTRPPADNLYI